MTPEKTFFWDATNNSWRPAVVGEPGDLVWNGTGWQPGYTALNTYLTAVGAA